MLCFSRLEYNDPPEESFAPAEAVSEFWDENPDFEQFWNEPEPEFELGVIELTPFHSGEVKDI